MPHRQCHERSGADPSVPISVKLVPSSGASRGAFASDQGFERGWIGCDVVGDPFVVIDHEAPHW